MHTRLDGTPVVNVVKEAKDQENGIMESNISDTDHTQFQL